VAWYRIHQFDIDGRVVATSAVDCADDDAAVQALGEVDAAGNAAVHATELWIGRRCVKRSMGDRVVWRSGWMTWPRLS
jgi:hypothetical protein